MSKIKTGRLDQYGKVQNLNWIGGERVNQVDIASVAFHKLAQNIRLCQHTKIIPRDCGFDKL